jgi:tungstate transport system ATP-binding protein
MPADAPGSILPSILPLRVSGLGFAADSTRFLDDVSFVLPRGGITAVIGPNGAGKSLLLRLCHGLIARSRGDIAWAAGNGAFGGVKRHAMVFQHPVMLRRSARANVIHALSAARHRRAARIDRADEALDRFGLAGLADRPARLMSGGEQQRLAIARAWALSPEVIFLDEPCSQLDPGATRQIELIIAGLAAEGMTILMTTHDLGQARRLSQRVLFLHKGRLIEDAGTLDFFAGPASPEGKAFISGDLLW